MRLRHGRSFSNRFIANLLLSLLLRVFKVGQQLGSYDQERAVSWFF